MSVDPAFITTLSWISRIVFFLIQHLPFKRINGTKPAIYGVWNSKYYEPTAQKSDIEEVSEVITLEQLFSYVRGVGRPVRATSTEFIFMGRIRASVFEGQYIVKNSNNPSGRGFFQLIIAPSHDVMDGCCIWLDRDTKKIESSKYKWNKLPLY